MDDTPERLSDLVGSEVNVRITCRRCGFEEDWTPDALAQQLTAIGGSQPWTDMTRHLRCRHFGCGSMGVSAVLVPTACRAANMPRRIGRLDAQLISAALTVLEAACRRSRHQPVATIEVRLALLVVHRYARDRKCVRAFWSRASIGNRTADEGLAEPLNVIRHRLISSGWLARAFLVEESKVWPWDSPAPVGWRDAESGMPGLRDEQ